MKIKRRISIKVARIPILSRFLLKFARNDLKMGFGSEICEIFANFKSRVK